MQKKSILKIKKTGKAYKFDKDNYLISYRKKSNIQKKWLPPLQEIVNKYNDFFVDGSLHSIYVRGSVASGMAFDNLSDIDLVVLFKNKYYQVSKYDAMQFFSSVEKDIKNDYPFVAKIDGKKGNYYKDIPIDIVFKIKHQSICIYGENMQGELPKFKKDAIPSHLYNLYSCHDDIIGINNKLLNSTPDSTQIKAMMKWASKVIVRSGFQLVFNRINVWSRDLYQCYKLFSDVYPEKQEKMKLALIKAILPTDNKNDMIEIYNEIGDWIIKETRRVI
tara:strand:- start:2767 stop:3594 length:828 start_codon:yes stop_codon:yes gene_type:complete